MKKTKLLVPAMGMLLLSTAASVTGTVAWFSANKTVTATGMIAKATTSESLVIDKDHEVGTEVKIALTGFTDGLTPITYADNTYKYNTNPSDVNASTGLAEAEKTLTFAECEGASKTEGTATTYYYYDYVVYLAASGQAMTGKTLKATTKFGTATYTQKAVTVAFSVLSEASADISAQAVALAPSAVAIAKDDAGSGVVKTLSSSLAIPLNTTKKSIPVVMRTYIDGALIDSETSKAYVNTDTINTNSLSFTVDFTIE